jgi:hypothetical protein
MNAYSQSGYEASKRYKADKIKRVPLDMQLEDYDKLKAAAEAAGERVNAYIKKAIEQRMQRDQECALSDEVSAQIAAEQNISIAEVEEAVEFGHAIDVINARIPGARDLLLSDKLSDYISMDQARYHK